MLNINPTKTKSWKKLLYHFNNIKNEKIINLFKNDKNRFNNFSLLFNNEILIDYSKNLITFETINLFFNLLKEINFNYYLLLMLKSKKLNITEDKFVLNFLLRDTNNYFLKKKIINKNLILEKNKIDINLNKIEKFTFNILNGYWLSFNNKRIFNIVNIGIGGSDIGPRMIVKALSLYKNLNINSFFVSNIDIMDINNVLNNISPENTIFIICSKTFTTQETILNAKIARKWILNYFNNNILSLNNHFILITSNLNESIKFGVIKENIFIVSDWVGGRYSFCSAFGLSISLSIGFENFKNILKGSHDIDKHFFFTKYNKNIPIILAIISIWYNNFFNFNTELILVYNEILSLFPYYLQQLVMESNGKCIDRNENLICNYNTSSILWGGLGTVCQHSFFQLLHQGTYISPCDFIIESCFDKNIYNSYYKLVSNFIAQTQSLAFGDNIFLKKNKLNLQNNFNKFLGNRPSNVFLIKKINPYTIGALISIYEYKVFVQGIIWNICSYDQWGVELGKKISNLIYPFLNKKNNLNIKNFEKDIYMDSSTLNLIKIFNKFNKNK